MNFNFESENRIHVFKPPCNKDWRAHLYLQAYRRYLTCCPSQSLFKSFFAFFLKISWSAQNSLSFRRENVHPFYRRNRSTLCKNLFEKTLRILHNSPPSTNCSWFWSAAGISWSPLLPPSLARNSLNNFKSYSFLLRINILLRGEWRHRYPHEWGGI